jgi:hypothetical protein
MGCGAPAAAKTAVPKSARDEIGLVRASFRHPGASVDFFYTVSTQPARITCTPTKNQRLEKTGTNIASMTPAVINRPVSPNEDPNLSVVRSQF